MADPRQEIEAWLEQVRAGLLTGPSAREQSLVRAALAIIDAEHPESTRLTRYCEPCKCVWPCPRKAEHEKKLLEAIRG